MPAYPALLDPAVDSFKVQRESINSLIGAIADLEIAGVVPHNQDWNTIDNTPTTIVGYNISDAFDSDYGSLNNIPSTFTPEAHVHNFTDITTGAVQPAQLSETAVTSGTYNNATITVDANGRLTAASDGSAGTMSSFGIRDDAGSDILMSHAKYAQFTSNAGTGGAVGDLTITTGAGDGSTGTPFLLDFKIEAAPRWTSSRSVTFSTGDVTGSFSINGSADVTAVALSFNLAAAPNWTGDHTHSNSDIILSGTGALANSVNFYGTATIGSQLDSAPIGAIYYEHEA